MRTMNNKHTQSGFALLVSLVVVSVVVSVGLVMLDITTKQLQLSTNSVDSEVAFHAANAGAECALYWRDRANDEIVGDPADLTIDPGGTIDDVECFDDDIGDIDSVSVLSDTDGEIFKYNFSFDWSGVEGCTEIDMLVGLADFDASGDLTLSYADTVTHVPGYPSGQDFTCPASSQCTVVASRGYNKACADIDAIGTVQREVLLEF